jgi:hypothetical protein
MKLRTFFAGSLLAVWCCGFSPPSALLARENVDHLVPVDGVIDPAYQRLLSRELYLTPANCMRIVLLPSAASIGETALSFNSTPRGTMEQMVLTCTTAQRNLWSAASEIDSTLRGNPAVRVRRLDVRFPNELSKSISQALKQMIAQSRQPRGSDQIVIDGTDVLFTIENKSGPAMQARLAPESEGKKSKLLRTLVDLLREYCRSNRVEQEALTTRIEAAAQRLTSEGED